MLRYIILSLVLLQVAWTAVAETTVSVTDDGLFQVEETLIYEKDLGGKLVGQRLSPDNRHIAVVVEKKGRQAVWSDLFGLGSSCREVAGLFFSPDSKRLAVVGWEKDGRQVVLVDGEEIGHFEGLFNNQILFTDDSRHFVFVAGHHENDVPHIVVDGVAQTRYSSLQSLSEKDPSRVVSVDGGQVIYFARQNEDHFIVVDGEEGPSFEQTGFGPALSEDGRHVAYAGLRDSQWYVMADTTLHGPFPEINSLCYPPGAVEPSYVVNWPDSSRIFVDHKALPGDYKLILSPGFDNEGNLWCYWASIDDKAVVVGPNGPDPVLATEHHSPSTPWISNCGHHYVYEMVFDKEFRRKAFVVDGSLLTETECGGTYKIQFSDNGERFATICFVRDPLSTTMMIDDTDGPYSGIWVDPVTFTADGTQWATRVIPEEGQPYVLVDGREVKAEGECGPVVYSDDGHHLAYTVSNDKRNKEYLMIDGTRFKTWTSVGGKDLQFSPDGSLTLFARHKDHRLYRVLIRPEQTEGE